MELYIEVCSRVLFSIFVGTIIGLERKQKGKPAGVITNTLVCLGATMLSIFQQLTSSGLQLYGFTLMAGHMDPTGGRIIAQIVSGIGFLGAGTIIREKTQVFGITTASMLWIMACLGIIIGYGFWFLSVVSFVSVVFVIFTLKSFNARVVDHKNSVIIIISCNNSVDIPSIFDEYGLNIHRYKMLKVQRKETGLVRTLQIKTLLPQYIDIDEMIDEIGHRPGIVYCASKKT